MSLHPKSMRSRLALWNTAILTAMLVLLGATSIALLDRGLRHTVDDSLNSLAQAIADSARRSAGMEPGLEDSLQSMLGPALAERFYQLLDPLGQLDPRLAPSKRSRLPLSAVARRNAEKGQSTLETVTLADGFHRSFRLLTMPVVKNGEIVNIVQVAMSLENVEAARSSLLFIVLVLAPFAVAGAAAGGWFLAARALSPVEEIVDAARKIEGEDLSRRIPAAAPDTELGRLTAVLNNMLDRIETAFVTVCRFSADAAHELRTPLTILKGEIEVALRSANSLAENRRTLTSCLEEVDRLNSLVEDLLLMARIESNALSTEPRRVNLAEIMQDVGPALTELAARAENTVRLSAGPSLWVEGYESLLFRLLFNLAENAIKYTPPQGLIEITLQRQNGAAVWEVTDTGPGIPSEVQAHLFERFYRGDPARQGDGTGLGLALVRSIVQLHHGRIDVSSTLGKGSTFRVTLPLTPQPAAQPSQD